MTRVALASGRWALWSEVAVRSSGFPAADALRLNSPELARQADSLLDQGRDRAGWTAFQQAFAAGAAALEKEIQTIAGSARFQCALAWQNHHALRRAVLPLLDRQPGADQRTRRHRRDEELVASYWQRYCLKNDTIGFFGPVGWGRLTAGAPTSFRPAAALVDDREVYFESWAVDRLAAVLAEEPGMGEWVPPRRMPYVRVEGTTVFLPGRRGKVVLPEVAEALRRCDGTLPGSDVATALCAEGWVETRDEALDVLAGLQKKRWISWSPELPAVPHPEEQLRRRLEAIGPAQLREPGLARLDALLDARDQVGAAGEDPRRLVAALDDLDTVFGTLTRTAPTRNEGRTYGGRTLVYHDARRALDVEFGSELLRALAPLELVLDSARWLTYRADAMIRAQIRTIYDRLAARDAPVTLAALWFECMSVIHGTARRGIGELVQELQSGWHEILSPSPRASRLHYRADALRRDVRKRFRAPHPGWLGARHLSPDIMLAADGPEAISGGDFEAVLGELHLSIVAFRHHCMVDRHPDPARLFACLDEDCPRPRLLPMLPKDNPPRLTVRTHPGLIRDGDLLVGLYHQTADPHRPGVLHGADLLVEAAGDSLVALTGSGERFDVMEPFSEMLMDAVIDAFAMFGEAEHAPRVTFDRLVVGRETWRFPARELLFSLEKDEARRFAGARAWRRRHALPQRIFVKSPYEQKPFFVDFDSPAYVTLLAKAVRRTREADGDERLVVTEMLPDVEQLWLTDADRRRYTAELRLAAVDLRENPAWALPAAPGDRPPAGSKEASGAG